MKTVIVRFLLGLLGFNLIIATVFFWVAIVPPIVTGTAPLWVPKIIEPLK